MTDLLDTPSRRRATWHATDDIVLRIAGMAIDSADGLRFEATSRWTDEVLTCRSALAARGAALSDPLHDHISGGADQRDRGELVSLRRDIFNNRVPRDLARARALASGLPGELGDAVACWLDDRQAAHTLELAGENVLAAEIDSCRAALRTLATHPRFRQGLVLASPSLDSYLDGYLRAGDGPLPKRLRRVERSLLDYVYRVACKTSPFSSFTGVSLARLDDDASDLFVGEVDAQWDGAVRINVAIIGRIIEAVVADRGALAALSVALTPGWSVDLEKVRFVRRSVSHGDDDATVSFDTVRDSLLYLRRNGTLRHVLHLLDVDAEVSVAGLIDRLQQATGEDLERCQQYVLALIRVGLLWLPELRIDVHADDPLRAFACAVELLDDGSRPWAHGLAPRLADLADTVQSYVHADLVGRRAVQTRMRAQCTEILSSLGRPDDTLPATLLFEDTRAARAVVGVDRRRWQDEVVEPLTEVSDILPAFDLSLPGRLLLKGFFLTRYGRGGRCDDVLRMIHEFGEDIYDEYGRVAAKRPTYDEDGHFVAHENWLRVPDLDALSSARALLVDQMQTLWAAHDGSAEMIVPHEMMHQVSEALTLFEGELRPQGFFLQLGGSQDAPDVIINRVTSGMAFSFSRFTQCFTDIDFAARVRDAVRTLPPRGAVLAEVLGGLVHTNLNVHSPLTDHQLLCPAEHSSFLEQGQLPLEDLYVVHDEQEDRLVLRSRRLEREVVPVYLGYLMPTALPETARTLLLFSPMGMSMPDMWGGVPEAEAVDSVVHRPRLRYRNVVLARRRWSVPAAALPTRPASGGEAGWLLEWRAWQTRHGLPDQVFVTFPQDSDAEEGGWARRSKPSYLDFTSLFSLTVFDAHLRTSPGVIELDEMSPTRDELYVRSDAGRHVCELAVEITRIPEWTEESPV